MCGSSGLLCKCLCSEPNQLLTLLRCRRAFDSLIEMAAAAHIVTGVVLRRPALVRQAGALLQQAKVHNLLLCPLVTLAAS